MASVTYTAKRNIIAGHTISTSYSFDFSASQLTPDFQIIASHSVALSGTTEGIVDRVTDGFSVAATNIQSSALGQWKEFLASVGAAEIFTFDPYGTISSPDDPQNYIIERGSASIGRLAPHLAIYTATFRARAV